MTQAIAHFMRQLEDTWDAHNAALQQRGDVAEALSYLAARSSIQHIPARTGAGTRADAQRFYAQDLVPHLPADLSVSRISRTVDRFRLVDEATFRFTHDRELPWLLPGIEPTHRRAEVLAIAIVGFDRSQIASQRILWDHTTLTTQLGLPALALSL
jgi:carboxymethylenebutenolidase